MIVKYNSLDKTETPILTLCNPGSTYSNGYLTKVVGILTDYEAEEIVFNFNSPSELNFRINSVNREVSAENTAIKRLYDAVKNRRLIFIDGIGYFSITSIDDSFQDGITYKDVKAQSIEVELQQKQIPYIADGTYRFLTDTGTTNIGIFNRIVDILPLWTIGHIDETVKSKWRTFEDVDVTLNCLGFLVDNVQDAYECIILFDIINRQINVYEQSDYVHRTGIQITKDDIIKSLNIAESAEDLYTAISVQGDEDLGISSINPLGGNVIYNFHYYLDWMSSSLKDKVIQWQALVDNAKDNYYQLNLNYYEQLERVYSLQAEIERIDQQLSMYTRCKENIIATSNTSLVSEYSEGAVDSGGESIVVYADIADTVSALTQQIDDCKSDRVRTNAVLIAAQSQLDSMLSQIRAVNSQLAIANYFTQEEYGELINYIFEGSYTDDYIKVTNVMTHPEKFQQMKSLYDRAQTQLLKVSEPTQEFDVDSESVIFDKNFSHWNDQLETGCLISVELAKNDWAWLFLSSIIVNYDDKSLKFTFGNRFNKYDTKSLFDKVLGSISKSANTLQYVKDVLYPLKDGTFDDMQEAIQSSRSITMTGALVSENEEVVIDGSGYTGKEKSTAADAIDGYDPHQIKITGRSIVFTDDAWSTSRTAVGQILLPNNNSTYGINAETVVGNLILGSRIRLQNTNQTMTFDGNGLAVSNDTNSFIVNPSGNTLFSIKQGNTEILGLNNDGSLHIVANGSGIDLSTNSTIRLAFNNISQYIQFEDYNDKASFGIYDSVNSSTKKILLRLSPDGLSVYNGAVTNNLIMRLDTSGMRIYDGNGTAASNLKMNMNTNGVWYYQDGTTIGKIGTSGFSGTNYKGIVFDLNVDAAFMAWGYQESAGAAYSQKWTYWSNNNNSSVADADTLNAGCPIDMHSFQMRNATLKSWNYITGNDSGSWSGYTGTLSIGGYSLVFYNGVLRSASNS